MRSYLSAVLVRRSLVALLIGVLTATLLTTVQVTTPAPSVAAESDKLKNQQGQVKNRIRKTRRAVEHSSRRARQTGQALQRARSDLSQARKQLRRAQQRLQKARTVDRRLQQRLTQARQRLERAREALAAGQSEVAEQRAAYTETIVAGYQDGPAAVGDVASYLAARTPSDLAHLDQAQRAMEEADEWRLDSLRATEVMLGVRKRDVQRATDAVAERKAAAARKVRQVKRLTGKAARARDRVRDRVEKRRTAAKKARKARKQDRAALTRLRKREKRIRNRIEMAVRKEMRTAGYRGPTKGLLGRPVEGGYVSSEYGHRRHPIYGYWGLHDGVDYAAPCGTRLRAVAPGTVYATYYSAVYGRRVYLNVGKVNGNNITVVYNHLSRYGVRKGRTVRKGQTIGRVGTSGWSTGCHLHFTVLRNGRPVRPGDFL